MTPQPAAAPERFRPLDAARTIRDIVLRRDEPSVLERIVEPGDDVREWKSLRGSYVALRHPDHIEQVLVAGHDRYVKAAHYRLLATVTGKGLLTNEGEIRRVV